MEQISNIFVALVVHKFHGLRRALPVWEATVARQRVCRCGQALHGVYMQSHRPGWWRQAWTASSVRRSSELRHQDHHQWPSDDGGATGWRLDRLLSTSSNRRATTRGLFTSPAVMKGRHGMVNPGPRGPQTRNKNSWRCRGDPCGHFEPGGPSSRAE